MKIRTLMVSLFAALAGCSGAEQSYCDQLITCMAGNNIDRDACVQSWIARGKIAADYSCSDAYHNYLNCVNTSSTCSMSKLDNTCSASRDALDSCESAASVRGSRHFLTQP